MITRSETSTNQSGSVMNRPGSAAQSGSEMNRSGSLRTYLIHFFRWVEGRCSRKFDRLFRFFDPLSRHFKRGKTKSGILRRMGPFSKSATPLATESVNSARILAKKRKVRIFGKGKCKTHGEFLRDNDDVTSVYLCLSLSVSLCLTERTSRTI